MLLAVALRGAGLSSALALAVGVVAGVAGALRLAPRLPESLDGSLRRRPILVVLWFVLGVGAVAQTGRLGTFMVDESRVGSSVFPFDDFFVHHSCVSAYFAAAKLQRAGTRNLYERTLYEGPEGEPKFLGTMATDVYLYPPPFLLLPRLGLLVSGSFRAWRPVWFGLEGGMVLFALLAVAAWIGNGLGLRAALLVPLVWVSLPTMMTLQLGNFHIAAIAVSMLAMLAFERERHALGGALLAGAVVSKIFPGILILYLLFRRRWQSAAWATGFAAAFVLLALVVLGKAPFAAFLTYHLPRLSSGAAFETLFTHPDVIACNHAFFGLVQKLSLLGVPGMSDRTASVLSWLYTVALVGVAAAGARVVDEKLPKALVWLALLQLAALRSPFSPDVYAHFALLWILTLLMASGRWTGWRMALLAVAMVLANDIVTTEPPVSMGVLLALALVHQLLFLALCVWVVLVHRAPRPARATT